MPNTYQVSNSAISFWTWVGTEPSTVTTELRVLTYMSCKRSLMSSCS